ncbi:MAG TPA: S41 family peptidase [Afifellaceae bacterium]|nr:S41 family peptidase [Afifellaceae bacterium]
MKRQFGLVAAGAIFGALAFGSVSQLSVFSEATAANTDTYRQLNLFGDVFERVLADYVEEPNESQLIEAAVEGMLSSLDPHSSYLNPKSFEDMRTTTSGEFGGLGIEVTMENDLVKVVTPIDDTPAARAGVLAGDLISHLDGEQVLGMSLREAVDKMRGPINSPITLTVIREGVDDPIEIKIIRDVIRIRSVRHRVEKDVGYIRITQFNEKTADGLAKAIKEISAEVPGDELKGYVLDLRNNPGGLLDQAIAVSDAFLDRGEIVSTRGRQSDDTQRYSARPGDDVKGKPVIILVNGGSASASEIVAGALQDHRRGTVVGSRSFGKGSVQTIIPLGRNGAIRLTTARYYTPSGRSIQAKGVVPDIEVIQPLPDEMKGRRTNIEGESALRGHLDGEVKDGEEEKSGSPAYVPPDPKDDVQINYALDLLRGIKQHAMFPPDPSQGIPN